MRDVKVSTEMLQSLQNDVQQLRLMKASKVGTSRLVDSASEPTKPVRPNRLLLSALSVMLGLIAGLALVTIRHLLDGGLADADDIERQTGMTVYTTVPQSSQQARVESENKEESTLLAVTHPEEAAIESLRSFRTALQFALAGNPNRSVVITGPAPGIGKSFISANLAAVAASGKRAVLIDADLRRGSQHRHFGVKRSPGLSELLLGAPLDQVVQRDVLPGLDFISTGAEPPLSADVFLSPCMDALLEQLRTRYDIVIIDTAPVLAAADAGILAGKAGAVFLVARAEKTTVAELVAARRSLEQAGAEVRGVIFNGLIVEGRWYRSNQYFGKYRYMSEYGTTRQKQA
jgi:tyrosine-protein kinase Etk/Wzc